MTTLDRSDASGPGSDGPARNEPVEVVRSEERLNVGTVVQVSGRAVLRRHVVTETVTQTFEVRHEEFRVDHEPLVDDGRSDSEQPAVDERAFAGRFVETVLHHEVPVVTMQVVAAERVRVYVDTVTNQVRVSEELARERVEVDVPAQLGTSAGV